MPNPGNFHGSRLEFLLGEKPAYELAAAAGQGAEAISNIQRRYFKRYPIELPLNVEPTAEFLANVDDYAADVDIQEPDVDKLTPEEYREAVERMEARRAIVNFRKDQIRHWFKYQKARTAHKNNDTKSKEGLPNPYEILTQKLISQERTRPRLKTPINMWRKDKRDVIEMELTSINPPVPKEQRVKTREAIARRLFQSLDMGEQRKWKKAAEQEHQEAMEEFNSSPNMQLSTDPEECQRAISGIVDFMQPVLDTLCEATGWKATLLVGGPEPAKGGSMNVLSVHSGLTSGDVKMKFGRAERQRFQTTIVPVFGTFLQKCYTPEECKARALPSGHQFTPISSVDESATVNIITPNYSASDALYSSNSATGFSATDVASSSTQQQPAITALGQIQTSGGCRDTLASWVDLSDSNPFPLDLYYSMSPPRLLSPMSDPGHSAPPSPGATPPPPQSGQPSAQPSPNINLSLIASHTGIPFQLTSNPSTIVSIEMAHPHHHVAPAPQLSHSSAVQINDPLTVSNISASALVSGTPLSTTGANAALIEPSTTSITKQTSVAVKSTSNKGQKQKRYSAMNGIQVSAKEKKAKKSNNNSEAQEKAVPRCNTRSSAPKEPISSTSSAMITPVIEESVILRSGNPAKPSKFWKYVDES